MPSAHSEWFSRRIGASAELMVGKTWGISVFLAASEALAWLGKLGSQTELP